MAPLPSPAGSVACDFPLLVLSGRGRWCVCVTHTLTGMCGVCVWPRQLEEKMKSELDMLRTKAEQAEAAKKTFEEESRARIEAEIRAQLQREMKEKSEADAK